LSTTSEGGLFLVLEGIEGAGKTTQARLLSEWMEELGIAHAVSREPGGTPLGEAVRGVFLEVSDDPVPPESEVFLLLAARAAFVQAFVRPHLEGGAVVLSDRFDLSTLAYQGYGRGVEREAIARANALATGGIRPHLYLLLDVEAERGRNRQRRQGKAGDRIEREGVDFLRRVAEGYRALAEEDPRIEVIDGEGPPERVQERLRALLQRRFPETFAGAQG